jgi:hypothetical protein
MLEDFGVQKHQILKLFNLNSLIIKREPLPNMRKLTHTRPLTFMQAGHLAVMLELKNNKKLINSSISLVLSNSLYEHLYNIRKLKIEKQANMMVNDHVFYPNVMNL